MMTRNLRIALVGGGLGGLAAAIALSRRGFDVRIFEQSNEIKEVGAGITLTPNAVKILCALGLEADLKKHGFEPESMVTRNWNTGHPLSRIQSKGMTADRFGAGLYHIHRADLLESLLNALPKGLLRLDTRCTSVASREGSAVLTMSDGSQEEADWSSAATAFIRPSAHHSMERSLHVSPGICAGARWFLSRCFRTIMCRPI